MFAITTVFVPSLMRYSLRRLSLRLQQAQTCDTADAGSTVLTFDKDDEDTLDFVAASANLRSTVFGIETKSKFDIKRADYPLLLRRLCANSS